ncbi:MAG: alpha/beta fold hydrolase [Rhizobiales bacterium]|nr:alpha/beta fold hydrolase [Hyphomicrobiales bacterium]
MQIKSNSVTFNCRVEGPEGASWMVLSHGLATDLTMWDELTEALTPRYRVLRYDARGHGDTEAPAGDYTLDMLVADVVGLLDALKIDKAHFCGLSMGGMVGQGLALDHPRRIISASICDSRHTTTPAFSTGWHQRAAEVRKGGIEAIVDSTITRWSSEGLSERRPDIVERLRRMIRKTSPDGYCGCAIALAGLNYGHRLGEIAKPMLFLTGSEDHGAPPEGTREMHRAVAGSRFVEITQAGHISNVEQPEAFNSAVLSLLDDVEAAAKTKETRP